MKIVIISDTHNKHRVLRDLEKGVPAADVLIHCGDATMRGLIEEVGSFGNWLRSLPYRHKLFVPGNHDFLFDKSARLGRELVAGKGVHVLIDQPYTIDGVKFYGTPWVPNLEGWAFYGDHITLVSRFHHILDDTNVLITHGPPSGLLDNGRNHYGSAELAARVAELSYLKLHCFGHIHESYGREDSTHISVNASTCDIDYNAVNAPVLVEI